MSSDPLKVLYCSFDVLPEPTGTSARATTMLRGLGAFNVDGLTAKSPDHPHIERFHGIRLMRVPVGSGDLPVRAQAFERAVRRQLESDEYHLVHFTDPYGGYPLCELKGQYGFKLVYEVVGLPSIEVKYTHPHLEGDRRFMAKLRRQELFCLMNADAVLVGSEVTARMVQGLGVSRERITVVPTTTDLAPYAEPALPPPDRLPMRVVYVGSQVSWQGLSTLLSAVAIALKSCSLRLAVVGPQHPSWRLQLQEMVKYRKLSECVELVDPVAPDDMPKLLSSADLGVAPLEKSERTLTQGAPIAKIAHYLAAGRPVIASDLPIVREVTNERCALWHKPGDEADLARCLVELAGSPERRVAMGAAALEQARTRLSADLARAAILKVYSRLLADAGQEMPASPAPETTQESTSDAPTSIGTVEMAPEGATLTHVELAREGPTDPFGRLAGVESSSSDLFTAPEGLASAPNLYVSPTLFDTARSGSAASSFDLPDAEPAAPRSDADRPPAEDATAAVSPGAAPSPLPVSPPAVDESSEVDDLLLQGDLLPELDGEEPPPPHSPTPLPWEAILGTPPAAPAAGPQSPEDGLAHDPWSVPDAFLPLGHEEEPPAAPQSRSEPSVPSVLDAGANAWSAKLPPVVSAARPESPALPGPGAFKASPASHLQPFGSGEPPDELTEVPRPVQPWDPPVVPAQKPLQPPIVPSLGSDSLPRAIHASAPPSLIPPVLSPQPRAMAVTQPPAALGSTRPGYLPPPGLAANQGSPQSTTAPGPLPGVSPFQPPILQATAGRPLSAQAFGPQPAQLRPSPGCAPLMPGAHPAAAQTPAPAQRGHVVPNTSAPHGGSPAAAQPADPATLSPASGAPPAEEWLGHLLFGYAPFRVPLVRRALTGELQLSPMQRR